MKRFFLPVSLIAMISFWSCSPSTESEKAVEMSFSLDVSKELQGQIDVPIVGTPAEVNPGWIVEGKTRVLNGDQEVAYQMDDLDGDGKWDEIAMLVDFDNSGSCKLIFDTSGATGTFRNRAQTRLGYSPDRNGVFESTNHHRRPQDHVAQSKPWLYQFEGPGWENDKVAFRSYFDTRNGKDIFGKTTEDLVLDQIGLPTEDETGNYHEMKSWGMDVLKVGPSLGSGGLGMMLGNSIIRLGQTEQALYHTVCNGPVRAILDLEYTGWRVDGQIYDLTERITIWGGEPAYHSTISISPAPKGKVIAGLVTMKHAGQVSTLNSKRSKGCYTHSAQSENHDVLGMAIVGPSSAVTKIDSDTNYTGDIKNTSFLVLNPSDMRFTFVAGWEKTDSLYRNKEHFQSTVERISSKMY